MYKFPMYKTRMALVFVAATTASVFTEAAELVPFTAKYSSEYGMLSATGVRKLEQRSDGSWSFSNNASALIAQVNEDSTFSLTNSQIKSLTYNFKNPLNSKRNMRLTFDWPKMQVTDAEHNETLTLNNEVYDKLSYQIQMQKDVCVNPEKFGGKDYTLVDLGKLKTYRVEFVERQPLKTKVGTLNTYQLRQFRPDKRDGKDTMIWLAADFNCVLARLDQHEGDGIITLNLTSANVNGVEVKGK